MKNTIITLASVAALAGVAHAQSYVDWSGTSLGNTSGTGTWAGYGNVNWSISYSSNSDGKNSSGTIDGPFASNRFEKNLDPYGTTNTPENEALVIAAGSIDGTQNNIGYDLTFTFSGGDFPSSTPVFYLGDVDTGDFTITASNNGVSINVTNWYNGVVQTDSITASGVPSFWNGTSLVGQSQSNWFVHEFKPLDTFDSLTFSYTNGVSSDGIFFGLGETSAVPEPSSTALLGFGGLALILRRKK